MAKGKSTDGIAASKRASSWSGDAPTARGLERLMTLAATQFSPEASEVAPRRAASAAGGMFVLDISEDLEITGQFLCKVPVAIDVLHCTCGGVMSQRLNESLFCRTCGREGSH